MQFALQRRVGEGIEEGLVEGVKKIATRKILILAFYLLILCRLFIY